MRCRASSRHIAALLLPAVLSVLLGDYSIHGVVSSFSILVVPPTPLTTPARRKGTRSESDGPCHSGPTTTETWSKREDNEGEEEETPLVVEEEGIEWGVSFIGGDPCGSKYNDDPFDARSSGNDKPGMPDDMKARIKALAEKKLNQERQQQPQKVEETSQE